MMKVILTWEIQTRHCTIPLRQKSGSKTPEATRSRRLCHRNQCPMLARTLDYGGRLTQAVPGTDRAGALFTLEVLLPLSEFHRCIRLFLVRLIDPFVLSLSNVRDPQHGNDSKGGDRLG